MEEKKIIVLVVDDDPGKYIHRSIRRRISHVANVISAYDQDRARILFRQHPPDIVMMDACVPGSQPNTKKLIREIKDTDFNGLIIGSSSEYLGYLKQAGCDKTCSKEKIAEVLEEEIKQRLNQKSAP